MKQLLAVLVLFAVLLAGALHAASIEKTAAAVPPRKLGRLAAMWFSI